jgi:hypothetical protein
VQWLKAIILWEAEMETHEPGRIRMQRAYHQAGHVVANLVCGFRFTAVTIRPEGSGENDTALYGNVRGRARDLAVVQLAGVVASALKTGRDPWDNPDQTDEDRADIAAARIFIDDWTGFLSRTFGESSLKEQVWDDVTKRTRLMVEQNWTAIDVVADILQEQETVSYGDILGSLKARCPDSRFGEKS